MSRKKVVLLESSPALPVGIVEMNQSDNLEEYDARPRGSLKLYRCERHTECKAIMFVKQIWSHECEIQTVTDIASARLSSDWSLPPMIRHRG